MLKRTFIHLPKVGPATELHFWREGLHTWEDFLGARTVSGLSQARLAALAVQTWKIPWGTWISPAILAPVCPPVNGGASLSSIGRALPTWTSKPPVPTGQTSRSPSSASTMAEVFINLSLAKISLISLKLSMNFKCLSPSTAHSSICRCCRLFSAADHSGRPTSISALSWPALAYKGGLKKIEPRFGLTRPPDLIGLDGYDAVLLWERARRGNRMARDLLLRYNREDVVNLESLMEQAYQLGCQRALAGLAAVSG